MTPHDPSPSEYVVPVDLHNELIRRCYLHRGFDADEADAAARAAETAARHGIKTHNGIKGLALDDHLGSRVPDGGCIPQATIEWLPARYPTVQRWNANRKLGQAVAYAAMGEAMRLADRYGVGVVAVDDAFHYLWGGGYVIDAALKGYIAYTCCTAARADVIPYQGKRPTIGTNPHSWAFPTQDAIGFPVCVDWATSVIASGRVEQARREGTPLPEHAAVDADGRFTTDPSKVAALVPFGGHKGYGLALIDELIGAFVGSGIPTLRCRPTVGDPAEKRGTFFYFQCLRPEAIECAFSHGRSRDENVKAVVSDILGHGNEHCLLPGQPEARAADRSRAAGGLLFTAAEVDALRKYGADAGVTVDDRALRRIDDRTGR